jgi:hypothetical protein
MGFHDNDFAIGGERDLLAAVAIFNLFLMR